MIGISSLISTTTSIVENDPSFFLSFFLEVGVLDCEATVKLYYSEQTNMELNLKVFYFITNTLMKNTRIQFNMTWQKLTK